MAKTKKVKFKTHKVIAKRIHRTKSGKRKGKILMRKAGQDHFNAREGGKTMRNKRRDRSVSKTLEKNINRLA